MTRWLWLLALPWAVVASTTTDNMDLWHETYGATGRDIVWRFNNREDAQDFVDAMNQAHKRRTPVTLTKNGDTYGFRLPSTTTGSRMVMDCGNPPDARKPNNCKWVECEKACSDDPGSGIRDFGGSSPSHLVGSTDPGSGLKPE